MGISDLHPPEGYLFQCFGFGEASPTQIKEFIQAKLWDSTKEHSRMLRLLTEAAAGEKASHAISFALSTKLATGKPAGLYLLESLDPWARQAQLLKNPFRSDSKPARALDKTFCLNSWFMAYTAPEHRGRGLAAWAARLAENMELDSHPAAYGFIPLIRGVDGAFDALEKGLCKSYPCRHLPSCANFSSEIHWLSWRFMEDSSTGAVFGRQDLSNFLVSDIAAPKRKPKA